MGEFILRELPIKYHNKTEIFTQSPIYPMAAVENTSCVIDRSKVKDRLTILNYEKSSVSVYYNADFCDIMAIRAATKAVLEGNQKDMNFQYKGTKIHAFDGPNKPCSAFQLKISRYPKTPQGAARRLPWTIQIDNGTAISGSEKAQMKPNSYKPGQSLKISLDDLTLYSMMEDFMSAMQEAAMTPQAFQKWKQTAAFVEQHEKAKHGKEENAAESPKTADNPLREEKREAAPSEPRADAAHAQGRKPAAAEKTAQPRNTASSHAADASEESDPTRVSEPIKKYRFRILDDKPIMMEEDMAIMECEINGRGRFSTIFDAVTASVKDLIRTHAEFIACAYPDSNATPHIMTQTIKIGK